MTSRYETDGLRETIGVNVKYARGIRGITQDELAEKMGWASRSNVCRLEAGGHLPRADTLVSLCEVLDVSADYLLGFDEMEQA